MPIAMGIRVDLVVETDAHEGPVYVAGEDALYFTTVPRPGPEGPRVDIRRLALDGGLLPLDAGRLTTVRADANAANGMALAPDGRLLVCEQGSMTRAAAITIVDPATGDVETLVDAWHDEPLSSPNDVVGSSNEPLNSADDVIRNSNKPLDSPNGAVGNSNAPLNSPNDVIGHSDGTVWFTDPSYGHLQGFRPAPRLPDRVYRYDPRDGALTVVADGFDKPNGLAFSPDERTLYVGDSGAIHAPGDYDPARPRHVVAFDVSRDGRLTRPRRFGDPVPGFPDGIKVDDSGRVYVSCDRGVRVLDPDGALVAEIAVPGAAVNFTFGGPDCDVLYITADDAIWAARLTAP